MTQMECNTQHVCVCTHNVTNIRTHTRTTHTHLHMVMHTNTNTNVHTLTDGDAHKHTHTHTHMHGDAHKHSLYTHTPVLSCPVFTLPNKVMWSSIKEEAKSKSHGRIALSLVNSKAPSTPHPLLAIYTLYCSALFRNGLCSL